MTLFTIFEKYERIVPGTKDTASFFDMDYVKSLVLLSVVLLSVAAADTCNMTTVCKYCSCGEDNLSVTCSPLFLQGKPFFPLVCENVTKLEIFSSDIAEINDDDMSHLKKLKVFKLTDTPLENISENAFTSLTSLKTLVLQNNNLSELQPGTFVGLAKIQQITIAETLIVNITVEHFTTLNSTLERLNLSDNKIEEITGGLFNDTNVLTALDLSGNAFSILDNTTFAFLSNVTDLSMEHNLLDQVYSGAFDSMTALETLNLANNLLAIFPFDILLNSAIKSLNLSDNLIPLISSIHISNMDQLETLDLDGNVLSEISNGVFSSSFQLKELHLSRNLFLSKIDDGAFETQSKLERLYLSNNPSLVKIDPNAFPVGLPTLTELYINDNALASIPEAMFNGTVLSGLTKVEAQGNPLVCSCDVIWIRNDMEDDTIGWIQPWKKGDTALNCTSPTRFNGTMVYQTDVETLTCDLPDILEGVQFLETNKANYFIRVLVSGGLPTTKWTTAGGITLEAGDTYDPGNGNNIISVQEDILANDTVRSQLLINHPTYEARGYYTLTAVNAGGVVAQQYLAKPPEVPDRKLRKVGLIVGLVVGGVIIIALVSCLVYIAKKKPYQRMQEETEGEQPTYGSVDRLVNATESPHDTEVA